jgi:hypothetical protein
MDALPNLRRGLRHTGSYRAAFVNGIAWNLPKVSAPG